MLYMKLSPLLLVLGCIAPPTACANEPLPGAIITMSGSAERLNIGQDGFCGKRSEINRPSSASFRIPAQAKTYFYVKTSTSVAMGTYYCEGDFSFTPDAGKLHIIRYSMEDNQCRLHLFSSIPGETPQPHLVEQESRRSCLLR